jgi:KaiC/GvpD/RAD55 family RecA-like ATPase
MSGDVFRAAGAWVAKGFFPVPIPYRQKKPVLSDWQHLRLKDQELQEYFNGGRQNIGVLLGEPYGNADVDLDTLEAVLVGRQLLPPTGMVFGRKSKRASHHFYRMDPPARSRKYVDPSDRGVTLCELRCCKTDGSIGLQTVVPPSCHEGTGESIEFEPGKDGHPANIDAPDLERIVAGIAAGALLARHWPEKGHGRHDCMLALAGVLARAGWPEEKAQKFCRAVYTAVPTHDRSAAGRVETEVRSTFEKQAEGLETTGIPSLLEAIGEKRVVKTVLRWLGIQERESQIQPRQQGRVIEVPTSMTTGDLVMDSTIKMPETAIENFLPARGLMLLGGRPKSGKTWFAVQTAIAFVTGQHLGDYLKVRKPGRAHLWALEDQFAITKDKLVKLLGGSMPDTLETGLRIFAELPLPFLGGGSDIISEALDRHPAELVVLDSLMKLKGAPSGRQRDIVQDDYRMIDTARQLAITHSVSVIIVCHTKKNADGNNPVENLLGTTGNSAAADALVELKRNGYHGALTLKGRAVPENKFQIAWHDDERWGWTIEDSGADAEMGETSEAVVNYLEAEGAARANDLARNLKITWRSAYGALRRLRERGLVIQDGKKWDLKK